MSRLDELIGTLCPDGIENKELKYVSIMKRGCSLTKKNAKNGHIPVISGGKEPAFYCDYANQKGETITVAGSGAGAGFVQYWNEPIFVADAFSIKGEGVNTKYLYYCLENRQNYIYSTQKGGGVPHVHISSIENMKIPVPPLEIQSEIVCILDGLIKHTEGLISKLNEELTARKQQYEYYSLRLIENLKNTTRTVSLSELGKWSGGKTPSMANNEYWDKGLIPWISSKDMKSAILQDTEDHITEKALTEAGMTLFPEGTITMVTRSGILKHSLPIAYVPFRTTVNQDIKALVVGDGVSSKYVFHVLRACSNDIRIKSKKLGGTVDSLDFKKISNYKIPLPSLDVQQRLVKTWDDYDAILNDMSAELSSEIEARQNQYIYYRDKLLTFKEETA